MDYTKRLVALSPKQRELLELRLKKKGLEIAPSAESPAEQPPIDRGMQFSLFYFSDAGLQTAEEQYRLLIEGARFADQHDFTAVWVPERHFQNFGGLYPNPSVIGAALAMVTERVRICAGSVVLPLHNPIRVAEDWSVIDHLSRGRVAISFASGWHPHDFVLASEPYECRKAVMFDGIENIRRLWAGESIVFRDAGGNEFPIKISPPPLQPALPVWITTSGDPETWIKAAEIGANVLAALIGQTADELARKIQLYREALARHGHAPWAGQVTVMLHTFIDEQVEVVRAKVQAPLSAYLRTFIKQHESKMSREEQNDASAGVEDAEQVKDAMVSFALERYLNTESLLGTPAKCYRAIERLRQIGVDEVACLIDFGVDLDSVMGSLRYLDRLRSQFAAPRAAGSLQGIDE